jgi:hypothetical protein
MVSSVFYTRFSQKLTQNANTAQTFTKDSLSIKVYNVALQIFEHSKDFLKCSRKTLKTTLWISPLNIRVGFSFNLAPINYRIAISAILITITNLFLAAIEFAKLPKKINTKNDEQIFDFLKAVIAPEIEEIKQAFQAKLDSLIHEEISPELILEKISYESRNLKNDLAKLARSQSLRVLEKESPSAFNRLWMEEFETFCNEKTQEALVNFHLLTEYEYSLLKFLDKDIIKEKVLAPLPEEAKDKIVSKDITYDTIFTWLDQINWDNKDSLNYISPLYDPERGRIYSGQLKGRIEEALNKVKNKTPAPGAPPSGTKEFTIFYERLEYKIKSYIQRLLEDEAKLKEKIDVNKYKSKDDLADLDPETRRELCFLCENKARFCCQIAIAGPYCPVRLNNEVSQLWTELFGSMSADDEQLPLEESIKKIFGYARLKIAKEEIAFLGDNTHTYGAYMQSIGQAFNIPGAKDEIEHMKRFDQDTQNIRAQEFCDKYTSDYLIEELRNYYKEEKRQSFREKIQQFLQENMDNYNQDKYTTLFETIQRSIKEKLEELEDLKIDAHSATNLFIQILNGVDPLQQVTLDEENGKQSSVAEISAMFNNNDMTFEEFRSHLLSLDEVKEIIKNSEYYKDSKIKNFNYASNTWSNQLKDLNCEQALAKLAQGICNKNAQLQRVGQGALLLALTRAEKLRQIRAIIFKEGLTGVECNLVDDDTAFARSLRNAILVKQKSDYLAYCLNDFKEPLELAEDTTQTVDLPESVADTLLVKLGFLKELD